MGSRSRSSGFNSYDDSNVTDSLVINDSLEEKQDFEASNSDIINSSGNSDLSLHTISSNHSQKAQCFDSDEEFEVSLKTPTKHATNKSFTAHRTPKPISSDESDSEEESRTSLSKLNISPIQKKTDIEKLVKSFNKPVSKDPNITDSESSSDIDSKISKTEAVNSTYNSSFYSISSKNHITSDSDSDGGIKIVKNKKKKQIRAIESDSENEIVVLSSRSVTPNDNKVINLSSDEEDLKKNNNATDVKQLNHTIFKQPTLPSMLIKQENPNMGPSIVEQEPVSTPSLVNMSQNKDAIYCTQKEYILQATKVGNIRTDLKRTKLLQSTINKDNLPDKGLSLMQRQISLEKSLEEEEQKLKKMIVENEEIQDKKPNVLVPWEQLQAGSSAVVPDTWGKQAMATHTMQKSLTMDRLKDLHGSLETCPAEDVLADNPKALKIDLMKHQRHALAWLSWRESQKPSGGILADDMGLGKTLTMISLVLKAKQEMIHIESDDEKENDEKDKKKRRNLYDGGTLVICPASLIKQWEGEVTSKCKRNALAVELYHGTNRESKAKRLAQQDMIITTYNLAMRECDKKGPLYQIKWRRVILDEAHQVRNHKAQTSVAVCSLYAKSRWALTGTPVHNKELDLYALLKFLHCSPFDDLVVWKRWVVNKNAGGQDRLNTVMKSIMLRRTKVQLQAEGSLKGLPEKNFEVIEVKLDKLEAQVYQKILIFSRTLFAQFLHQRAEKNTDLQYSINSRKPEFLKQNDPNNEYHKMHQKILKMHRTKEIKSHEILVLLLRLRQICCHPSLITGMLDNENIEEEKIEDEGIEEHGLDVDILDKLNNLDIEDDAFEPNVDNVQRNEENLGKAASRLLSTSNEVFNIERQNEKIRQTINIIQVKVIPNGDKAVIVSQWTSMLRIVLFHLKEIDVKCDMLDGSVPVFKRNEIVENFNNSNNKMKVLLLSLTAGGVGLNLVGGNHLILLDLHWNPQLESQAQDRIYRVGQTKPVVIYKLVTLDTIEERIKALQEHKLQMACEILSGVKTNPGSKLSLEDLKMLFSV